MEETGSVKREVPINEEILVVCLVFAETALQPMSRKTRNKIEKIIPLVSDSNFDTGELRSHVKEIQHCKRIFDDCRYEDLAKKGLPEKFVTSRDRSSVSGAALYKKECVAAVPRQMAISSTQDVFFGTQAVPERTKPFSDTLRGMKTQKSKQEKVVALRSSDV